MATAAERWSALAARLGADMKLRLTQALADARYVLLTSRGAAGGVATLGADGKVPSAQLPASSGGKPPMTVALGAYNVLTNVGAAYDTIPLAKGLGHALIDFTGATAIELRVYVNKVGTGTQSWQLWDIDGAAEVLVANDAAAAGERVVTATKNTALPTGTKHVRLRAKSTIAADDPVYYGATVKVTY
jgi:hypothetical protein